MKIDNIRIEKDESAMLEGLLDKYSLWRVLVEIAHISDEKAEHVLSAWRDSGLSRRWYKASEAVSRCANSVAVQDLP